MWLATRYGFYSIVRAHQDGSRETKPIPHPDLMMIRARKHQHLAALKEVYPYLPKIRFSEGTDYPYRIIAKRERTLEAIARLAEDIDYTNFKNAAAEAKPKDSGYMAFLHRVWATGLELTPAKVAKKLNSLYGRRGYPAPNPQSVPRDTPTTPVLAGEHLLISDSNDSHIFDTPANEGGQ